MSKSKKTTTKAKVTSIDVEEDGSIRRDGFAGVWIDLPGSNMTIIHIHAPSEIVEIIEDHPGGRKLPIGIFNFNINRVVLDHDEHSQAQLPDTTYYCRVPLN